MTVHTRIQKLRQFPPGRARQAASNIERVAFPLGYHALHPHTRAVRDAARRYIALRTLRFGERKARGDGDAAKVDRAVDVRVAFIYDAARRSAADLPGTAEGDAGARILRRYFPQGLRPVVSAPYEEELIQVEALVEGLRGDLADDVALLSIGRHVAAAEALLPAYAVALDQERKVTPAELRAAWLAVHHAVLELAFAIVVRVTDEAHRASIIGPILEHDDRLAALYTRRQRGQGMDEVDLDIEVQGLDDLDGADDAAFDGADDAPFDEADDVPFDEADDAPEAALDEAAPADAADEPAQRPLAGLPRAGIE